MIDKKMTRLSATGAWTIGRKDPPPVEDDPMMHLLAVWSMLTGGRFGVSHPDKIPSSIPL